MRTLGSLIKGIGDLGKAPGNPYMVSISPGLYGLGQAPEPMLPGETTEAYWLRMMREGKYRGVPPADTQIPNQNGQPNLPPMPPGYQPPLPRPGLPKVGPTTQQSYAMPPPQTNAGPTDVVQPPPPPPPPAKVDVVSPAVISKEPQAGLSFNQKVGIGIAAIAVIGGAFYLYKRR